MNNLSFEPLIPGSLWLALAAVAVLLFGWYASRRPASMSWPRWFVALYFMFLALGLVFTVLLNPTWVREIPPPAGKPLLNVLVDASGSMATADGAAAGSGTSRFAAAAKLAAAIDSELEGRFDVRLRSFSDRSSPIDLKSLKSQKPDGQATDLATVLAESLAEERAQGQATVLLSDGIHNISGGAATVLEAVRRAKSLAAPIYTRTIGGSATGIDLAVDLRPAQDLAFIGQRVPVTVRVGGRGLVSGARGQVSLLLDGAEIGKQEVDLSGPQGGEARFWVRQDKTGLYAFEARVDPVPGEATQANNSATYLLRVIDQPVRVLVLEGKPYWDSKFLMRTLSDVPAVELESIVRVADGRLVHRTSVRKEPATQPTATPAPPAGTLAFAPAGNADDESLAQSNARTESWKVLTDPAAALGDVNRLRQYQVILLGREAEVFLSDQAVTNLQNWVSRDGGALVCSRGPPTAQISQRLARLLPVTWSPSREARFRMRLTDEGREMRWLGDGPDEAVQLTALPTLAASAVVDQSKPLAVILAMSMSPDGAGGQTPAVVYQPYGTGRVVVIEGAGMWRWAFMPPQFQKQEQVYAGLWHSLLRWITSGAGLLPGQKMTLRADRISFTSDDLATATLLVREDGAKIATPTIELTGGELKEPQVVTPTVFGDEPGTYRVNFGKLPQGRYQARVSGSQKDDVSARCVFDVKVVGREPMELDARPDLMARIAADSGGAVLSSDAATEVAKQFKEHMARVRPPRYERATAWDRPWVLLAAFALWTVAWAIRRSGGLI